MESKYEGMSAAQVVEDVMIHGLSIDQEDICKLQDIFGNTAIVELAYLANNIGRENENGEPDPEGSWSSGRKGTQSTFYMILFHIWNWEDATRFWNQYTNPERRKLLGSAKELREELADAIEKINELKNAVLTPDDLFDLMGLVETEIDLHEEEIVKLAAEIVEKAECPDSADFRQIVKDHRNERTALKYWKDVYARLAKVQEIEDLDRN